MKFYLTYHTNRKYAYSRLNPSLKHSKQSRVPHKNVFFDQITCGIKLNEILKSQSSNGSEITFKSIRTL